MRKILQLTLLVVALPYLLLAELPECQSEADKIKGCVEKQYHANGHLPVEIPYKNGEIEGIVKIYHANGKVLLETPYTNGKANGVGKGYHGNGVLAMELPYKNGKREGVGKWYYMNGNLMIEATYKEDKEEGAIRLYNFNGKLVTILIYEDSKAVSGKCTNGKELSSAHIQGFNGESKTVFEEVAQYCGIEL